MMSPATTNFFFIHELGATNNRVVKRREGDRGPINFHKLGSMKFGRTCYIGSKQRSYVNSPHSYVIDYADAKAERLCHTRDKSPGPLSYNAT